jgi:hypothetical protein
MPGLSVVSAILTADSAVQKLFQAAVYEAVGQIIRSAGSDHAAQLAKAQEILSVVSPVAEIFSGNPAGVKDLQAALHALGGIMNDPAHALTLNTVLAVVSNQQEAHSGLLSLAAAILPNLILGWVVDVCKTYVAAFTPAPASAAA